MASQCVASSNIIPKATCVVPRLLVFHWRMSWLKADAVLNLQGSGWAERCGAHTHCLRTHIEFMLVTLEVSHTEMSWLKILAPKNMSSMAVTLEVSHPEMSPLKLLAP